MRGEELVGVLRTAAAAVLPSLPVVVADVVDELRVRALLDRLGNEIDALRRLTARDRDDLLADDDLDVFAVLADASLLGRSTAADLRDTARFRNLLVHGYARVDDTRVVDILHERVGDLAAYRTALARAAGG